MSVLLSPRPATLLTQPRNRPVVAGQTTAFYANVAGSVPLSYQWRRDGTNIDGATNAAYTVVSAQSNHVGNYSVAVSNVYGAVISSNASLFLAPASAAVGVFDDPLYVNTTGGGVNAESDNVQATVQNLGYAVLTFTNFISAASVYHRIIIPAQERASLALSPAARTALSNFVFQGGKLIVHENLFGNQNGRALLNGLFGLSLESVGYGFGPSVRSAEALGTEFADDAVGLSDNYVTMVLLRSSLPVDAVSPYANAEGSAVAVFEVGAGTAVYMGWNWYDAAPLGARDGGWSGVLESALLQGPLPHPPVIVSQPATQAARLGTDVSFSVAVSAIAPFTYQWQHNGTNLTDGGRIGGAMSSDLTIANFTESDAGLYSVMVSNNFGTVPSSDAMLAVKTPDHFTWSPISSPQITNVPFTVTIQAQDFSNQIVTNFAGTVALTGMAVAPVSLTPMVSGNFTNGVWSGSVRVLARVTNLVLFANDGAGSGGQSNPFHVVRSNEPPVILTQPVSQTVRVGTNVSFSVDFYGAPTVFTWGHNSAGMADDERISGAHTPVLTISNVLVGDAGSYSVFLANTVGVFSANAFLTVNALDHFAWSSIPSPMSTLLPRPVTVEARDAFNQVVTTFNGTVALSASVAGSGMPVPVSPITSGTFVAGVWNGSLSITQIVSNVVLRADNGLGDIGFSAPFDVAQVVAFSLQPTNQNVLPGTNVTLIANAVGTGPVRYQWRFEGTNISGATNASYSFTGANLTNSHGNFSVVAQDDIGTAVSSNAFIFVLIKPGIVTQPQSVTVLQGGTASFSVVATGAPPLWYRWIRSGSPVQISTVPVLVLSNVQSTATIRVVVTNTANAAGVVSATVTNIVLPDFDGDGMSNREEYLAGTNPTNALSVLKIVLTATNANVLQFVAQTNISYSVQWRPIFSATVWSNLTSITAQPLVRTIRVEAVNAPPDLPERYFRVVTPLVP